MILILGKGATGNSFARYCEAYNEKYIFYTDHDSHNIDFRQIKKVFISPGFKKSHFILKKINCPIYNDFNLIESHIKNKYIIGITGTKGKSTTASMIYHMLKSANYDVVLGGNVGIPILELNFNHDIYIFEVSSFHLEWIYKFPWNVSILTALGPDHLDRYQTINEYYQTKMRIMNSTKKNALRFIYGINANGNNEEFVLNIFSELNFKINKSDIEKFKTLEHRFEIFKYKNITLINDSCATNSLAVQHALKKINKNRTVWLVGGIPKEDVSWINKYSDYRKIIFGKIGNISCKESIHKAAEIIYKNNIDTILFSPGGSSFDEFKNSYERGNFFKKEVICALKKYI